MIFWAAQFLSLDRTNGFLECTKLVGLHDKIIPGRAEASLATNEHCVISMATKLAYVTQNRMQTSFGRRHDGWCWRSSGVGCFRIHCGSSNQPIRLENSKQISVIRLKLCRILQNRRVPGSIKLPQTILGRHCFSTARRYAVASPGFRG